MPIGRAWSLAALIAVALLVVAGGCKRKRPSLHAVVDEVATESGVPASVLLAIVFAESRLSANPSAHAFPGWVQLATWRPLRDPRRAATLLNLSADSLLKTPKSRLRAAGALLADAARPHNLRPDAPPTAWRPALESFNGERDPIANKFYADQIMAILATGFRGEDDQGNVVELVGLGEAAQTANVELVPRPADAVGATFVPYWPASLTTHRPLAPTQRTVKYIIIHTTQGSFAGIFEYFRRADTKVAAHYLIRAFDGLTVQMVDERLVAFHDACFNEETIGIEHEGYVDEGNRWFSDEMYRASAKLVRDIAARHGIPLDRAHILGHNEAPDCSTHTDPGAHWDWDKFMRFVRETSPP